MSSVDTILFDLDGTLLPMDQDAFIKMYFASVQKCLMQQPVNVKLYLKAVMAGTQEMIQNDGSMLNAERFWSLFEKITGDSRSVGMPVFESFYRNEFEQVKASTAQNPLSAECIAALKRKGYHIIAATNPVFPPEAVHARLRWAGLKPEYFDWITTYDNSSYCKPNLNYYREILQKTGRQADKCMMVGNDVREDMCASELGMDCYLITDCMLHEDEPVNGAYKKGSYKDFALFVEQLPFAGK